MVGELQVLAERLNQQRSPAQVVTGQGRKQVVLYLELQSAVEPVQPCWAAPVHCSLHLHPHQRLHASALAISSHQPCYAMLWYVVLGCAQLCWAGVCCAVLSHVMPCCLT